MTEDARQQGQPWAFFVALALSAVLCVVMLVAVAAPPGNSGEERMSAAFASFFLVLGVWIALALLLIMAGVMGDMPRRGAIAAVFLHPLSGGAGVAAADMVSRHIPFGLVTLAALPAIVAFYAAWARLPGLRAKMPEATGVTGGVWGSVVVLSAITFLVAAA